MKKRVFGKKLGRERDTRLALFKSLGKSLILHGKIKTTKAKAKATQAFVEKLVRTARQDSLLGKRNAYKLLGNDRKSSQLLSDIALKFSRDGGFTKTTPLPERRGDMAQIVRLEWSEEVVASDKKQEKTGKEKSGEKSLSKKTFGTAKSRIKKEKSGDTKSK